MFNAAFRACNGRISALYMLDLMQSDTLYFSEDEIVSDPPRYRVEGMQLDPDRMSGHPEIAQDIAAFSAAVLDWAAYCEKNADIFVPSTELPPQAAKLTNARALTPITLMNLLCRNALSLSRQENIFLASAGREVQEAIPALDSFLRRLLRTALEYDGCASQQVIVLFASDEACDVPSVLLRRRIVAAAAPLDKPFDAQRLKTLSPALDGFTTDKVDRQLAAFARRGVLHALGGGVYTLDCDSREAALLFAEGEAADLAARQRPLLQERMLQLAAAQVARVQKGMNQCKSTLTLHQKESVRLQTQTQELTPLCPAARKKADRMNSASHATFSALLLIFFFLFSCAAAWLFFFPNAPQMLFSLEKQTAAFVFAAAGAVFLVCACLRAWLAARAKKKAEALESQLAQTQRELEEHQSCAAQAQRESNVYTAYLVLTRTIFSDMKRGDFRGLNLALAVVPAELCAMLRENAPAVRAKIIVALSHCGACTHSELAFLSGAGHDPVRRALYGMIAAGQVSLRMENGAEKYGLSRALQPRGAGAAEANA